MHGWVAEGGLADMVFDGVSPGGGGGGGATPPPPPPPPPPPARVGMDAYRVGTNDQ